MKKLTSVLLLCSLLLLSMVGCLPSNNQAEGTTPATTTENTTPGATTPEAETTTPGATTPEAETTTPEETTPDATMPPENNPENPPTVGEELDKNSTLVWVLSDFWTSYDAIIDWNKSSLADKVAKIKDGTQALHVFFDPSNYYYVAGYYNPTHSYEEKSCCVLEYNWVKYENETQIQEYYNGMKCRVVIQINKELHATNIVSKESTIADLEYIQLYTPLFTDGVNTAAPIVFDTDCFYLREDYEGTLYICKDIVYYYNVLLSSVCLDGQYYMPILLTRLEKGETLDVEKVFSGNSFREEFGEYYDAIRAMMVFNKYSLEYDGKTSHYGLIPMDEFVNEILNTTTPEDDPIYYPPNPLVIELFGEEDINFWAEILILKAFLSDWSSEPFTVRDGNIYHYDKEICEIYYSEDIEIAFADASVFNWIVDQSEEIMAVMEKIENSEGCYVLKSLYDDGSSSWTRFLMYDIDGVYYFIKPGAGKSVLKFYRFVLD